MNMQDTQIREETLQFIQDIQHSSLLEKVCYPIDNCVFAYVCGSRLTGLASEKSDIDIVVIVKDKESRYYTGEMLRYHLNETKTITVQWFPLSVANFFETIGEPLIPTGLIVVGLFQFGFISEDLIIFKNDKYDYIFQNFIKEKERIQRYGAYKFAYRYQTLIHNVVKSDSIDDVYRSYPTFARLCYIADFFEGKNFLMNIDEYKAIKRRKNLELHYDYIKDRLLFLQQYLNEYPMDIKQEERALIDLMLPENKTDN